MKVTIQTSKSKPKQLESLSSKKELFLIIMEGRPTKQYLESRFYFEIKPELYAGTRPKRSFQVGQLVQLQYERYPTIFKIHDIFKGASGDEILVLSFNWDAVENPEDINR